MLDHGAASLDLHSLSVRFTFSHLTSGARAVKRPLPVCQTTRLEASMPTRHKPCSHCIYNIFIYKQIDGGEGGTEQKRDGLVALIVTTSSCSSVD